MALNMSDVLRRPETQVDPMDKDRFVQILGPQAQILKSTIYNDLA